MTFTRSPPDILPTGLSAASPRMPSRASAVRTALSGCTLSFIAFSSALRSSSSVRMS